MFSNLTDLEIKVILIGWSKVLVYSASEIESDSDTYSRLVKCVGQTDRSKIVKKDR